MSKHEIYTSCAPPLNWNVWISSIHRLRVFKIEVGLNMRVAYPLDFFRSNKSPMASCRGSRVFYVTVRQGLEKKLILELEGVYDFGSIGICLGVGGNCSISIWYTCHQELNLLGWNGVELRTQLIFIRGIFMLQTCTLLLSVVNQKLSISRQIILNRIQICRF